jgi:hypothetical protein
MANFIGPFPFLRIDGEIAIPLEQHVIETRAGIDGSAVWATGSRAEPRRLMTTVDVANEATAWNLYRQYTGLIRYTVKIMRNDVSWPNYTYLVLRVEKREVRNHLAAVGGLFGGATLLICTWDVLPMDANV